MASSRKKAFLIIFTILGAFALLLNHYFFDPSRQDDDNPSPRYGAAAWAGSDGAIYIFGGWGRGTGLGEKDHFVNNMWRFDPARSRWQRIKGTNELLQPGRSLRQGEPHPDNIPGARREAQYLKDAQDHFWLFSGNGLGLDSRDHAEISDLWSFSHITGQWTLVDGGTTHQNWDQRHRRPAPHTFAAMWSTSGGLWLLGSEVATGGKFKFNDVLWLYHPTSKQWRRISEHDSEQDRQSCYGIRGQAAPNNHPGSRSGAATWTTPDGALWLFGGKGKDIENKYGYLSDVWRYDPAKGQWTWVNGNDRARSLNSTAATDYGQQGVEDPRNMPPGLAYAAFWCDREGNLWLWGGESLTSQGTTLLNDVWKYNPKSNCWTWLGGSRGVKTPAHYGVKGLSAPQNIPGTRKSMAFCSSPDGALWIFGGEGMDAKGKEGYLNDLWQFNPQSGQWTWVAGDTKCWNPPPGMDWK